ncbi:copper fist DNA binding domain-containing protein [Mycena metata]|uniref:Copper fist DNA binding domain-containing protein n=1 Tax=Mycena metata TaxID=1033252 RepID=A0AAD7KI18_9AGAR|nr:copper fist DNA binding domain-containing protein [Mycena metata]
MVFVNNKKFACESCIKGHRSSSCHHTDRPLFEIKKKGRPVSQCEKCRELRQSRRVHSKCSCPQQEAPSKGLLLPSSSTKSRRYIPIIPALPNGLRDAVPPTSSRSPVPPDSRQRVDSLLNPCNCRSVWKCKCRAGLGSRPAGEGPGDASGLATLAQAAALCCSAVPPPKTAPSKRQTTRPNSPNHASHKRPKHINTERPTGPDLPPIFYDEASPSPSIPFFEVMPPMSKITSLAGSGCTCGLECACPGCVEHRGPEYVAKDRPSCADGCGTCVDARAGLALPGHETASSALTSNIIDQFFARAAALPAPPTNRRMGVGVDIDPMNVMVYPSAAMENQQRGLPFGLVSLPKLECCGGQCACPDGSCNCKAACNGCCSEHRLDKFGALPQASPAKSCCAR